MEYPWTSHPTLYLSGATPHGRIAARVRDCRDLPSAGDRLRLAPLAGPEQVSRLMPRMLLDLQNRGQLAAGFTTFNPQREKILDTYKQIGTVIEAFRLNHQAKYESIMEEFAGRAAIGHVRYATCGANDRSYAQPFERHHGCKWKWFTFAFNGQLANFAELRDELLTQTDYHLTRNIDTEVIMHYLSHELSQCGDDRPDLVEVFRNLSRKFDGAYNLVFLNAMGDMVVLRDPNGFRPLCYAQDGPLFAAASESVALLNLGFHEVKSLEPGEMILIQDGEIRHASLRRAAQTPAHCFFEWIYFANVASTLDDRSVYLSRAALGQELARQERRLGKVPLDDDTIVVPVPDTGKAAADAMAFELGRAVGRRADPQSLHRPHVHRGPEPRRARAAEIHAAARGAGRQARPADRGHHRPQHDDEGAAAPTCASAAGPARFTSASPVRRSSRRASTASTCPRCASCSRRAS